MDLTEQFDRGVFVFSMSRSGHNAIINWLCQQEMGHPTCYRAVYGTEGKVLKCRDQHVIEYARNEGEEKVVYYDMENCPLTRWDLIRGTENYRSLNGNVKVIIIIRDFYNWVASFLKHRERHLRELLEYHNDVLAGIATKPLIYIWQQHAKECLSITASLFTNEKFLPIKYNKWVVNEDYRHSLCVFGSDLEFTDKGKDKRNGSGGGSSFGGDSDSDVLSRWKVMLDNEDYITAMREAPKSVFFWNLWLFDMMEMPDEIREMRDGS